MLLPASWPHLAVCLHASDTILYVHYFIIYPTKGKWMKIYNTGNQIMKESSHFAFLFYKSFQSS